MELNRSETKSILRMLFLIYDNKWCVEKWQTIDCIKLVCSIVLDLIKLEVSRRRTAIRAYVCTSKYAQYSVNKVDVITDVILSQCDGTRTYTYNTVYIPYSTGTESLKRLLMIQQQHIFINDYNVSTVYDTDDQYTVTCLILVRHNKVRANTTY